MSWKQFLFHYTSPDHVVLSPSFLSLLHWNIWGNIHGSTSGALYLLISSLGSSSLKYLYGSHLIQGSGHLLIEVFPYFSKRTHLPPHYPFILLDCAYHHVVYYEFIMHFLLLTTPLWWHTCFVRVGLHFVYHGSPRPTMGPGTG